VESSRITPGSVEEDALQAEEPDTAVIENPIIDVREEPLTPPPPAPQPEEYRGSHRRAADPIAPQPVAADRPVPQQPEAPWRPPEVRRGRHWSADDGNAPVSPEPSEDQNPRTVDPEPPAQPTGGHSVADLMARLQVNGPVGGGGRRRRED